MDYNFLIVVLSTLLATYSDWFETNLLLIKFHRFWSISLNEVLLISKFRHVKSPDRYFLSRSAEHNPLNYFTQDLVIVCLALTVWLVSDHCCVWVSSATLVTATVMILQLYNSTLLVCLTMITVQQWRAAIGCFSPNRQKHISMHGIVISAQTSRLGLRLRA